MYALASLTPNGCKAAPPRLPPRLTIGARRRANLLAEQGKLGAPSPNASKRMVLDGNRCKCAWPTSTPSLHTAPLGGLVRSTSESGVANVQARRRSTHRTERQQRRGEPCQRARDNGKATHAHECLRTRAFRVWANDPLPMCAQRAWDSRRPCAKMSTVVRRLWTRSHHELPQLLASCCHPSPDPKYHLWESLLERQEELVPRMRRWHSTQCRPGLRPFLVLPSSATGAPP